MNQIKHKYVFDKFNNCNNIVRLVNTHSGGRTNMFGTTLNIQINSFNFIPIENLFNRDVTICPSLLSIQFKIKINKYSDLNSKSLRIILRGLISYPSNVFSSARHWKSSWMRMASLLLYYNNKSQKHGI